ncbi:MAG TPA: DNA mismatch repair endonuclease MutL [Dehalococcoidia bacterium]|nr:DNA mismatch repair endonuclease MutL [Dehalococcoidia bacterium]
MTIRVLPPDVAARIAAGEVIERPASIVKELVENSLDAGASRVVVEITGGGVTSIRVTDDGSGIVAEEMATAFERHATSKLADDEDLARVLTLGFRGEALPSIAAVAEVELVSRPPSAEAAARLAIGPERPPELASAGAPVGTTMTVRKLFARQPARGKFLRAASSEGGAIAQVVSHYALAYPEVRFQLIADGRQSRHTPGSGDLRDAVAAVYGLETAGQMLDVKSKGTEIEVRGLAGPPELSRSSRSYISLFVNRRWIQSRRLAFAVEGAYQGMLMVGRHPIAVLDLRVPPGEVDVNVHPTKAEVRFRDESAAFSAVQKAVRAALVASSPVALGTHSPLAYEALRRAEGPELTLQAQPWTPPLWERGFRREEEAAGVAVAAPVEARPTPAEALPVLRVIGQFGGVYIIAEGPEGMYLIDQHAAHERVLYEQFKAAREARTTAAQGLLEAVPLELSPGQHALVAAESEALAAHGFDLEPFGEGAYVCRSVPAALAGGDLRDRIGRFLDLMQEEGDVDGRDRVAMSLACHGAVRAGKTLSPEEMRELVLQLEATEAPHTCPHGRPTMVHVSAEMLARGFGRR